jgi:hypothetical protein
MLKLISTDIKLTFDLDLSVYNVNFPLIEGFEPFEVDLSLVNTDNSFLH